MVCIFILFYYEFYFIFNFIFLHQLATNSLENKIKELEIKNKEIDRLNKLYSLHMGEWKSFSQIQAKKIETLEQNKVIILLSFFFFQSLV